MITRYFTFGFDHVHEIGGFTFDHNVLVRIAAEDPRAEMVAMFGTRWATEYDEPPAEEYWPRGMRDLSPAAVVEPVPVPSDADRLREVAYDAALILAAMVGDPKEIESAPDAEFHTFDPEKRAHVLVNREEVPEILWRGCVKALDFLRIGIGFSDPDAPPAPEESFEAEVDALLRGRKS